MQSLSEDSTLSLSNKSEISAHRKHLTIAPAYQDTAFAFQSLNFESCSVRIR